MVVMASSIAGISLAVVMIMSACTPTSTDPSTTSASNPTVVETTATSGADPATPVIGTSPPEPADGVVDVILKGGVIVTMSNPVEAEAMAIDGDLIVAVGDETTVLAEATEDTLVVDLGGRVVFPGFIDGHSHWYQPGRLGDYGPEQINQILLSRGWTGTNEVNLAPHFAEEFLAWHEAGRIDLRMNAYLSLNTPGADQERYLDWFSEYEFEPGSTVGQRLSIPGIKIFIASDWDSYVKWSQDELTQIVAEYHDAGWQIAAKQISDESLEMALKAFEGAYQDGEDRRHRLEHGLEMLPDHISRLNAIDLVPIVQLGAIESDFMLDEGFQEMVSDDGVEVAWPFRDMIESGMSIVGSIAVAPLEGLRSPFTISVMQMLHGSLTGISEVGNEPWPARSDQLMTIDETLESLTVRAAWSTFEENSRGQLADGMLADFVVMSDDLRPAAPDPEVLRNISVDATFVGGELLWCGFGLDDWCRGFGQTIPDRLLDESTLAPLAERGPSETEATDPPVVADGPVSASSIDPAFPPEAAFDGDTEEGGWLSADPAPGWIEIDLGSEQRITTIHLWVDQEEGQSHHKIYGGSGANPTELLGEWEGETSWGQMITIEGVWTARYFRIETVQSPAAFGWLEIDLVDGP